MPLGSRTIDLSPAHIGPQILISRVTHCTTIKARKRRSEKLRREVLWEEVYIVCGEGRDDGGDELAGSSLEQRAGAM